MYVIFSDEVIWGTGSTLKKACLQAADFMGRDYKIPTLSELRVVSSHLRNRLRADTVTMRPNYGDDREDYQAIWLPKEVAKNLPSCPEQARLYIYEYLGGKYPPGTPRAFAFSF